MWRKAPLTTGPVPAITIPKTGIRCLSQHEGAFTRKQLPRYGRYHTSEKGADYPFRRCGASSPIRRVFLRYTKRGEEESSPSDTKAIVVKYHHKAKFDWAGPSAFAR